MFSEYLFLVHQLADYVEVFLVFGLRAGVEKGLQRRYVGLALDDGAEGMEATDNRCAPPLQQSTPSQQGSTPVQV